MSSHTQAFYAEFWECFPDGGAEAMSQLMRKKEEFARKVMDMVLKRALGYSQGDRGCLPKKSFELEADEGLA